MSTAHAHCNECGGKRNHAVLHSETTECSSFTEGDIAAGWNNYEMLKCLGCDAIILRHTSWWPDDDDIAVNYFPPLFFRKRPDWLKQAFFKLPASDIFVADLLNEIYSALQNNQRRHCRNGYSCFT